MSIISELMGSGVRMNRATRLRDENLSDDELKVVMNEIISSAVIAQTGGTKRMQQRAIEEMKQARQDMITQNVNLGGKAQNAYLGKITGLIDNLENIEKQNDNTGNVLDSFKSNLPSADTLISGLMTANPLIGYGVKMTRDLFSGIKDSRARRKEEAQQRLQYLEQLQQELMGEGETETEKPVKDEKGVFDSEIYRELLENINNEIKELRKTIEFSGDDSLQVINENIETSSQTQEEILHIERQRLENDELQGILRRREEEGMGAEGEGQAGGMGGFTFFGALPEKIKGVLMGIGRFFKGIAMWGAGLAALGGAKFMGGIKKVFGGITKGFVAIAGLGKHAGKLLRVAGRMSGIGTVIMALWDFANGFINAGEFLNIENVDLGDRIIGGFLKVYDSLFALVDWIAGLFGFEIFGEEGREDIKNKLYNFYRGIFDWVGDTFNSIIDFFKDFSIMDTMSNAGEWASNILSNLWQKIKDKISGMIDDAWTFIKETPGNIVEAGKEKVDETVESVKQTGRDIKNFFTGDDEETKMVPIKGILSGEFQGNSSSDIFTQSMNAAEQLDHYNKKYDALPNIINSSDNRTINNTRILRGEKSTSNGESTMKNARMIRNIRFIDN